MDAKLIFYVIIIAVVIISNIYKGIKKAAEEQRKRQAENANRRPEVQEQPREQPRPRTEPIPDPWSEAPRPAQPKTVNRPAPTRTEKPRQKSIEEVLQEMMKQYEQPTAQRETLDKPYSTLDKPYSTIDKPTVEVAKKGYKFDESLSGRALTAKDYTNILKEDDVLTDEYSRPSGSGFHPREAYKYATLLERKYQ